jgi:adenylate cyclase
MSLSLHDIARCFGGAIPAMLATSSRAGEPNLAHLSQVFLVDDTHVALSNQFFTKTMRNLAENPLGIVVCVDPVTLISYKLLVRHERSEDTGSVFESVRRSVVAIAAMSGMAEVFSLRSVEVFRVLNVEAVRTRANADSA